MGSLTNLLKMKCATKIEGDICWIWCYTFNCSVHVENFVLSKFCKQNPFIVHTYIMKWRTPPNLKSLAISFGCVLIMNQSVRISFIIDIYDITINQDDTASQHTSFLDVIIPILCLLYSNIKLFSFIHDHLYSSHVFFPVIWLKSTLLYPSSSSTLITGKPIFLASHQGQLSSCQQDCSWRSLSLL